MATIGKLAVEVTADATGLSRGLATAGKETDAFESRLGGLTNKLKILGPAAIAAGGAFAIGMIKSVANTADELAKLSARTGVAVEDLSRLQFAAGLSGVANGALTASIERLSRGMADAAAGTGEAGKAFAAMGIEVQNQDGSLKSQRDVLEEVAERFAGYADGAEKSALAQQIFGRSGAQLIPLLNSGAKGLKDMADESDRLGNTISTNTAKAAERFNDNLTRMSTAAGGLARTISGPLIEALADFTGEMFKAMTQGESLFGVLEKGFKGLTQARTIEAAEEQVIKLRQELETLQEVADADPFNTHAIYEAEIAYSDLMNAVRSLGELQRENAEQAAKADPVTGLTPQAGGAGGGTQASSQLIEQLDAMDDEIQKRLFEREEMYIQDLERRLEFLHQSMMSEEEVAALKHEREMETLIEALEARALTEQEYMLMSQDLEMQHMDEIARIRANGLKQVGDITKQSYAQQTQTVMQELQKMTAASANGSRAMFNINKAASIANALLSARESVTNAYRFGSRIGGPKLGAAFAATAAAATAAQVRQLSSTSFNAGASSAGAVTSGGGSSVPSQSPAATLPNTAQAAGGGITTVNIELQGEIFGREQVRGLISQINEAVADGSVLRFA